MEEEIEEAAKRNRCSGGIQGRCEILHWHRRQALRGAGLAAKDTEIFICKGKAGKGQVGSPEFYTIPLVFLRLNDLFRQVFGRVFQVW